MALQDIAEWSPVCGLAAWTRFKVSPDGEIEPSIFDPLTEVASDIGAVYYGRIHESPDECMLVVAWKTPDVYAKFKESPQREELMANMKAASPSDTAATEPETQTLSFSRRIFWLKFGPNTEVMSAYLPASSSPETQHAVPRVMRLRHNPQVPPPKKRTYVKPPNFAWVEGPPQVRDGEQVLGAVWNNLWNDKESERVFKTTEQRYEAGMPLAVDVFERDLKNLGVTGLSSYHVNFQQYKKITRDIWGKHAPERATPFT
ncbi:hypothetical protein EDB81DRAFT_750760 [Dactylonectria macrodidyma]|uniref:Uncharacterized protein n=1 Tax=Dactylonectria macrodidyma TaxID=307937 RepID=A0A9P9JI63_9HYPO|nr:hypothetical protein EDB81DRAFT_750760 [Dactylonectria macrodidyma]